MGIIRALPRIPQSAQNCEHIFVVFAKSIFGKSGISFFKKMKDQKVTQTLLEKYVQIVILPVERNKSVLLPLKKGAKNCIIYHKRTNNNRMNTGFSVAEIVSF